MKNLSSCSYFIKQLPNGFFSVEDSETFGIPLIPVVMVLDN